MQAIVQSKYGSPDALQLMEVEKPTPNDSEVLVKMRAASVHADVWHVVTGFPYVLRCMGSGLLRPKMTIPGSDIAGVVESVGKNVTRFKPGDEVFGETHEGMQWVNGGAYAEYAAVPESCLATKPPNITFEQAASVPTSGIIAMWNLDNGRGINPGSSVLVNGAGGGVGMLAVQIAKAFGAEVTGVDRGDKLDAIRSLGADHVIDYTKDDFTLSGVKYDLIFDIPGNRSYREIKRALAPDGKYILIAHDDFGKKGRRLLGGIPQLLGLLVQSYLDSRIPRPSSELPSKKETLTILADLLEQGKITPIVGRTYPLSQTVEAMNAMVQGENLGKIVVTCED